MNKRELFKKVLKESEQVTREMEDLLDQVSEALGGFCDVEPRFSILPANPRRIEIIVYNHTEEEVLEVFDRFGIKVLEMNFADPEEFFSVVYYFEQRGIEKVMQFHVDISKIHS